MNAILAICSVALFVSFSRDEVLPSYHMNRRVVDGKAPSFNLSVASAAVAATPTSCVVHGVGLVSFSSVRCQGAASSYLVRTTAILRRLPALDGNFSDVLLRKLHLLRLVKEEHNVTGTIPYVVYVGTTAMQKPYRDAILLRRMHTLMSRAVATNNAVIVVDETTPMMGRMPTAMCTAEGKVIDSDAAPDPHLSDADFSILRSELRSRVLTAAHVRHRRNLLRHRKALSIRILSDNQTIHRIVGTEMERYNMSIKYAIKRKPITDLASPRMFVLRLANALFVIMPPTTPYLLSGVIALSSESVVLLLGPPEDDDAYRLLSRSVKSLSHLPEDATEKDVLWAVQDCIGSYMAEAQ